MDHHISLRIVHVFLNRNSSFPIAVCCWKKSRLCLPVPSTLCSEYPDFVLIIWFMKICWSRWWELQALNSLICRRVHPTDIHWVPPVLQVQVWVPGVCQWLQLTQTDACLQRAYFLLGTQTIVYKWPMYCVRKWSVVWTKRKCRAGYGALEQGKGGCVYRLYLEGLVQDDLWADWKWRGREPRRNGGWEYSGQRRNDLALPSRSSLPISERVGLGTGGNFSCLPALTFDEKPLRTGPCQARHCSGPVPQPVPDEGVEGLDFNLAGWPAMLQTMNVPFLHIQVWFIQLLGGKSG